MEKTKKTCIVCGKEFEARNKVSKYCPGICRVQGNQLKRKQSLFKSILKKQ